MLKKFHFSKFQNSILKSVFTFKFYWILRVHQILLTVQIWSLNVIFSLNPEHFVQQEDHIGTEVVIFSHNLNSL